MSEALELTNMDFGPCFAYFGDPEEYLGRTQGESTLNYEVETFVLETEEDGEVDEIVTNDNIVFTIPLVYTDVETLSKIIPWANVIEATDESALEIPKAIGKRLSDYAAPLRIHPKHKDEEDKTKDAYLAKAYPKPGPINFTYSRQGTRIANVEFVALEDSDGKYLRIGDPDLTEA